MVLVLITYSVESEAAKEKALAMGWKDGTGGACGRAVSADCLHVYEGHNRPCTVLTEADPRGIRAKVAKLQDI